MAQSRFGELIRSLMSERSRRSGQFYRPAARGGPIQRKSPPRAGNAARLLGCVTGRGQHNDAADSSLLILVDGAASVVRLQGVERADMRRCGFIAQAHWSQGVLSSDGRMNNKTAAPTKKSAPITTLSRALMGKARNSKPPMAPGRSHQTAPATAKMIAKTLIGTRASPCSDALLGERAG
jgi:hypothetical protein